MKWTGKTRSVLMVVALAAMGVFTLTAVSQPAWAGCGNCGGGEGHQHGKAAHAEAKAETDNEKETSCDKGDKSCKKGDGKCGKGEGSCEKGKQQMERLEAALKELAAAEAAIKDGKNEEALTKLQAVKAKLQDVHKHAKACQNKHQKKCGDKAEQAAHAKADRPAVVNAKCPIMGNKIDPDKVPANLYRVHNGKGVGFCCGGCPSAWDKLSDDEKTAKLKTTLPAKEG